MVYNLIKAKDKTSNTIFTNILFLFLKKNSVGFMNKTDIISCNKFTYYNKLTHKIISLIINLNNINESEKYIKNFTEYLIESVIYNYPKFYIFPSKDINDFDNLNLNMENIDYNKFKKIIFNLYYYVLLYYLFSIYMNYSIPNDIKLFGTNIIISYDKYDKLISPNNLVFILKLFVRIITKKLNYSNKIKFENDNETTIIKVFDKLKNINSINYIELPKIIDIYFHNGEIKEYKPLIKNSCIDYVSYFYKKTSINILDDLSNAINKLNLKTDGKLIICRYENVVSTPIELIKFIECDGEKNTLYSTHYNRLNSLDKINNVYFLAFIYTDCVKIMNKICNKNIIKTDYVSIIL
jgi:hypothetical protein